VFVGHFALGLAAKKIAPRTSLGTLMLSVAFVDVLWPFFLLLGWEHVRIDPGNTAVTPLDFYDYPLSHSLVTSVGWAFLFAAIYFGITKYKRGSLVVLLGVLSHWFLDFVSHRADMPLLPTSDSPKLGLGLWNSIPATILIELSMFAAGIWIYTQVTRPLDKIGKWGFAVFMIFLTFIYFGNVFGPPPPSEKAIGMFGAFTLVLFVLPYWIDRHREAVT
jgi:membrane-bound metal-dependent hydrolase YbcI (DUF457 family)